MTTTHRPASTAATTHDDRVEPTAWVSPGDIEYLAFEDGHGSPGLSRNQTDAHTIPLYDHATVTAASRAEWARGYYYAASALLNEIHTITEAHSRDALAGRCLAERFLHGLGDSDPCPEEGVDWDGEMDKFAATGALFDRQSAYEHGFRILRRRSRRLKVSKMAERFGRLTREQPIRREDHGLSLLVSLHEQFVSPSFVPDWVMPAWFAWASAWLGQAGVVSDDAWPGVVDRYARLAGQWHLLAPAAWRRAQAHWILECLSIYTESLEVYHGGPAPRFDHGKVEVCRALWSRVEQGDEPTTSEIDDLLDTAVLAEGVYRSVIEALRTPGTVLEVVALLFSLSGTGMLPFRDPQRRDRAALALVSAMEREVSVHQVDTEARERWPISAR